MTNPGLSDRERATALLTSDLLDLLVVGGGIVGAAIARDAAMRGLRTGLVEQFDFAFGTSSRSSRLLHGGLRYLAQGRLGLVREASIEKKIIQRIAPHLVQPLPFIFPGYRGNHDWRLWQLKIGVKVYDALCGGQNFGQSRSLSREQVLEKVPLLGPDGLTGAVRYYDAFTHDARLTVDTLRSAANAGAALLSHCRFMDARRSGDWECDLSDMSRDRRLMVRTRTIVNATGPWADRLPCSQVKLRLTKGIHIVLDSIRLPVTETVVMTEGKRILFAIPWGERTILGTTDTDYNCAPDAVRPEPEDLAYLLEVANRYFFGARLEERDVVSTWAGLRPLLATGKGRPSEIPRSHRIRQTRPGWWDVTGGKLTTCRLMAEQTVDGVLRTLPSGRAMKPCRTAEVPLLSPEQTSNSSILPPVLGREAVEHFVKHEWATHVEDIMLRRTSWGLYLHDPNGAAEKVAGWMGEILGWTAEQRAKEMCDWRDLHNTRYAAKPVGGGRRC